MRYRIDQEHCRHLEFASRREWLLTNGIGGYAMGTVSGMLTRRYHGYLVAATDPPAGRTMLLPKIEASIQAEGNAIWLSTNQYPGSIFPDGYQYMESFEVDEEAVWRYHALVMRLEQRLAMHPKENAVTVRYINTGSTAFLLTLRPLVAHRDYDGDFRETPGYPSAVAFPKGKTVVEHGGHTLYLCHAGAKRLPVQGWYYRIEHLVELERGLEFREDFYCPCELQYELEPGQEAVIVAADHPRAKPYCPSVADPPSSGKIRPMLEAAAKPYLVETKRRKSIIAGYPWFADWGRDTMIALPGLCLCTGRVEFARDVLRSYAKAMKKGLIPNRFIEKGGADYNTADGTLWFVNAVYKTLLAEWDDAFANEMMKALDEVFRWHVKGTLFGIGVDPGDGLLRQGEPGVQLTWMDAKVGDWVVTPRHGKPVEVNGLWVNALRVTEWLADRLGLISAAYGELAARAEKSFAERFWCEARGHYFDTVDPDDASLRPNQLIAMALPFGPATGTKACQALAAIERELVTPFGMRTLAPSEPNYRGRFEGPLPERDAAYHQGTVWPWLLGPYITALVKLTGDRHLAKKMLREAREMLTEYGLGGIAEVYDGDGPQHADGCPWQAWSVGEILRACVEDLGGDL